MKPICSFCCNTEETHHLSRYCYKFSPQLNIIERMNNGERNIELRTFSVEAASLMLTGTEAKINDFLVALEDYISKLPATTPMSEGYLSALWDTLKIYNKNRQSAEATQYEVQHLIKVLGL